MAEAADQITALREASAVRPRGLWIDAWRRLKRNKMAIAGAIYILIMALIAIFADVLAPHNPNAIDPTAAPNTPPFWVAGHNPQYLLGTDSLARDELSRLIYGARVSLIVGFVPVFIVTAIGVTVGMTSGWLGGRADNIIMRIVDVVYAFPALLFYIVVQSAFRDSKIGDIFGGLLLLFIAFAITDWVSMARLVRGEVLRLKNREFVEAAKALGVPTRRILIRHILPNSLAPIIVSIAFGVPSYILAESSLSYLGLGVKPQTPTWGSMVYDSFPQVTYAPEFVLMPSILIALIMLAFTFLGDGLRDALDPYMGK